jgi:large subunit ribosomal protein L10
MKKRVGQIYRETLVNRVKEHADSTGNLFLLSYSRLSTAKITEFRKRLKKANAQMYVSKNAITRLAFGMLEHKDLAQLVDGQTALVWTNGDSVEVSKVIVGFTKECDAIRVRGGLLNGRVLVKDDVVRLSDLPSREVLLAMLLGTIQAPLTRLAGALNGKTRELLSVLKQLSEKKGGK